MKTQRVVAALALAFALGIGISFTTLSTEQQVFAAEIEEQANDDIVEVSNFEAFKNAVDTASRIKLTSDIALTKTVNVVSTTLTLDLNGYNITTNDSYAFAVLATNFTIINSSNTPSTISAQDTVFSVFGGDTVKDQNCTNLTINRNITVNAVKGYGIAIADDNGAAYGVNLNLDCKFSGANGISINGNVKNTDNPTRITLGNHTDIKTEDTGIYAAGFGVWDINSATVEGQLALGIKAGQITVNNSRMKSTGEYKENTDLNNNGMNNNGSVFQIEHNPVYAKSSIVLKVDGGTYTSTNGNVFSEYGAQGAENQPATISIFGGDFTAANDKAVFGRENMTDEFITISGGTFKGSDVADFAENGYLASNVVMGADGVVTSKPSRVPQGGSSSKVKDFSVSTSDGIITVSGQSSAKNVKVIAKKVNQQVAAFGENKSVIYDIELLDGNDQKVELTGNAKVSIKLPEGFNGERSGIYYIDSTLATAHLASVYSSGVISFYTNHFSMYAIVDTTSRPVVETKPNLNGAPSTGALSHEGFISAVSTAMPAIISASALCVAMFTYKIFFRRRQAAPVSTAIECEIATEMLTKQQDTKTDDITESTSDRFVAVPMDRPEEKTGPIVDTFIPKNN